MRFLLLIITAFTFHLSSYANPGQLAAAVRGNDFQKVLDLLDAGANINEEDAFGRRAIFFVSDPDMARLLFARSALLATHVPMRGVLDAPPRELHVDSTGMTPLHYLLGITARNLLDATHDDPRVRKSIEDTAYELLRAHIQERSVGWLSTRTRLEHMQDGYKKLPMHYLAGRAWSPNFVERLRYEHRRDYRQLAQVQTTPWLETVIDQVFGRSYFFVGPGSL